MAGKHRERREGVRERACGEWKELDREGRNEKVKEERREGGSGREYVKIKQRPKQSETALVRS